MQFNGVFMCYLCNPTQILYSIDIVSFWSNLLKYIENL